MRWGLLLCCFLVVLAGCSGLVADDGEAAMETPNGTETTEESVDDQSADGETEASVDNPWGQQTVEVGLVNTANDSRDVEPLVTETIEYWNTEGKTYATYPVEFTFEPNKSEVDVMVLFRDEFECGNDEEFASGCAPLLDANGTVGERPLHVEIESGYTDESTVTILKHEFGHVVGLTHEDEPQSFMQTGMQLRQFPQPSHEKRANPWERETLGVYVEWRSHSGDRAETERQLDATFAAFNEGIAGVPSNVTFERVDDRRLANVTVEFDTGECREDGMSCRVHEGVDEDGHGDIDRLRTTTITLEGIDENRQGWHVGYWVAEAFAGGDTEEMPEIFTDAGPRERVDWWENI